MADPSGGKADKIGSGIKRRREKLGISQLEVALRAETSQSAINEYEHGRRQPRQATRRRLASALKTTEAALLGEVVDDDPLTTDEKEIISLLHQLEGNNRTNAVDVLKQTLQAFIFAQEGRKIEEIDNISHRVKEQ